MRPKIAKPGYNEGYGGRLRSTRRGRGARPLTTKGSMHLILKSTQATGTRSFKRHELTVARLNAKFAARHGLQILNCANAGNHLHYHLRSPSRAAYRKFVRALTSALAIAVGNNSRWGEKLARKFWDFRPFSRVVEGQAAHDRVEDYVALNELEMAGFARPVGRRILAISRSGGGVFYGKIP